VTNAAGCSASDTIPVIVIAVNPGFLTNFGLEVYPNPNAGQFTVRLALERDRNVTLRIFDLYGKQVWNQTGDLPFGEWKQSIDFSHLTKGTYMLDVSSEGQRATKKIVIQ
jgi:bacillolysin